MKGKIKVGTDHGGYANERNITGLPFSNVEVVRASNLFRVPNYLYFKAFRKSHPYLLNLQYCPSWSDVDVLHLFNGIHLGSKPWFSTFETFLPRWASYGKGNLEWGLRKLAREECKGLFALSACTAAIQADVLRPYPELSTQILPKIQVLHPPQEALIGGMEDKPEQGKAIKLAFAGADFFRKGGLEILRAFDFAVTSGTDMQMTVVSAMNIGDYASKAGEKEREEALKLMAKHSKRITHHRSLPNARMLEVFKQSDIGLLPTWADTYGYSVLEAQAAGCPVISTNLRALPEINNDTFGWLIPVPKDNWGNAELHTEDHRKAVSETIERGLKKVFEGLAGNPQSIREKGQLSLARIKENHQPAHNATLLEAAYRSALGLE